MQNALQSIDTHFNAHYGPYSITLLVVNDWHQDHLKREAAYTISDIDALSRPLKYSELKVHAIPLYENPDNILI